MSSAIARTAIAPVLAQPSVRAEQVTQLVLGETARIMEFSGEWRRVCTDADQYTGWIHSGYLQPVDAASAEEWRGRATGWSEGAVLQIDGSQMSLPLRARVVLDQGGVLLPDGRHARLSRGSIQDMGTEIAASRTTAPERWAYKFFLGSPYQWGGVTPWGVDCSGLVQTTFAARGISLPRDSAQQVAHGAAVALDSIRPGDLLFFTGETGTGITHVAFAAEADRLIHATLACGETLAESWLPGSRASPLRERLVAVRRLEER